MLLFFFFISLPFMVNKRFSIGLYFVTWNNSRNAYGIHSECVPSSARLCQPALSWADPEWKWLLTRTMCPSFWMLPGDGDHRPRTEWNRSTERASGVSFTAPKAGGAAESTATHPPRESALPSRRTGPDSASTRLVDCRRQRAIAVYAAITVHHTSWVVYGPRL